MTPTREMQTYRCHNKGCSSGGWFTHAPEAWWYSRGIPLPRNCQQCREWMNAQVDETATCTLCASPIPISAKRKISFHKREGAWITPSMCARCSADPGSAARRADAKKRVRRLERPLEANERSNYQLVQLLTEKAKYPGDPKPFAISSDPLWWQSTTRAYKEFGVQSVYDHTMRHSSGLQTAANASTPLEVVGYLSQLAASTDGQRVVQFTDGYKVVKLDVMTKVVLIIDPKRSIPITSYSPDEGSVESKIRRGNWT